MTVHCYFCLIALTVTLPFTWWR